MRWLIALLLTLAAPSYAQTGIVSLSDFGGVCDGATDNSTAFTAAINSFPTSLDNSVYSYAGTITFPPGQCYFASTIQVNRQVHLIGYGNPAGNAAGISQLLFADNIDGIAINHSNVPAIGALGADGTLIERLYLRRIGNTGGTGGNGINASARFELRNVNVEHFRGDGIHIVANSGSTPSTNANNWHIYGGRSAGNGGAGLFVAGTDANAGYAIGLDVSENVGYGVDDQSFLGNAYFSIHAAANVAGGYRTTNANATNTFFGCYQESGQKSSFVPPTIVFGGAGMGAGGFTSTSRHVALTSDTAGDLFNYNGSIGSYQQNNGAQTIASKLGGNPNNGDILNIYHSVYSPGNSRLRFIGPDIRWDYGNLDLNETYRITGPSTAYQFGRGTPVPNALLTDKLWVGNGNNARHQTTGLAPPATGTCGHGDIVWNLSPISGGYVGWVCTVAGTWATFGQIN